MKKTLIFAAAVALMNACNNQTQTKEATETKEATAHHPRRHPRRPLRRRRGQLHSVGHAGGFLQQKSIGIVRPCHVVIYR